MKKYLILSPLLIWTASLVAQLSNQNYIRTLTPRVEITAIGNAVPSTNLRSSVLYFDDLGRLVQTVESGITPQLADLVSLVEYDALGRKSKEWIPVPMHGAMESFRSAEQVRSSSSSYYNDVYGYVQTQYDYSPLARIVKRLEQGLDSYTKNRFKTVEYSTNASSGALSVPYCSIENGKLRRAGNYPPGALFVTINKDEDGRYIREFVDKEGRVIRSREVDYVYDSMGHLCFVLPDYGYYIDWTDRLYDPTEENSLFKYGYAYTYDERGNRITRKLPGIAPIYQVFDAADRPVLTQTPNQRPRQEWTFFKYDVFGRIVIEGTTTIADLTHSQLLQEYRQIVSSESFNGEEAGWGYTLQTLPNQNLKINKAFYYDNYRCRSLPGFSDEKLTFRNLPSRSEQYYATPQDKLTASAVRSLYDQMPFVLYTTLYYDQQLRTIQQRGNNILGGYDHRYTMYNFSDEIIEQVHEHSSTTIPLITERYRYTRDHAGREIEVNHALNGRETLLSQTNYDELGRVSHKRLGLSVDEQNYTYHIRNWLMRMRSNFCDQNYYYNLWPYGIYKKNSTGRITLASCKSSYKDPNTGALKNNDSISWHFIYKSLDQLDEASSFDWASKKEDYRFYECVNTSILRRQYKSVRQDNLYSSSNSYLRWDFLEDDNGADNLDQFPIQFVHRYPKNEHSIFYDDNGNLSKDLNKRITEIRYNNLNLPNAIEVEGGSHIRFTYDANGIKHSVRYRTVKNSLLAPIGEDPLQHFAAAIAIENRTDYCGNFIYEDGVLRKIRLPDGYINYSPSGGDPEYCYYLKDHVGSPRVIISQTRGPIQYADYYPFGIPFSEIPMDQDNLFHGGKELERMHGLNWYDNHLRWYDPVFGRFTTMDPLCELYYDKDPYSYCGGDPVNLVDRSGGWLETAWDLLSLSTGASSMVDNVRKGRYWDAAVDGVGVAVDAVALAVPIVPGGASVGIKAAREVSHRINREAIERGIKNEKRVLKELGEIKNTKKHTLELRDTQEEISVIPDIENATMVMEIKDTKAIYNTKQIRAERQYAKEHGKEFRIIVGKHTYVSSNIPKNEIIRLDYLGPQK